MGERMKHIIVAILVAILFGVGLYYMKNRSHTYEISHSHDSSHFNDSSHSQDNHKEQNYDHEPDLHFHGDDEHHSH